MFFFSTNGENRNRKLTTIPLRSHVNTEHQFKSVTERLNLNIILGLFAQTHCTKTSEIRLRGLTERVYTRLTTNARAHDTQC